MDLDDLFPKKKSPVVALGEDISRLSIPDLEERLQALEAERQRIEAEIHKRRASLSQAQAIFKPTT